jgi:hypothetical protein
MQRIGDTFQQAFCRAKYGKGTPFLYLLFSSLPQKQEEERMDVNKIRPSI